MTFSLATNPPGGVLQASLSDETDCMTRKKKLICVGEAILANRSHDHYLRFLICNTICFIASLSVILVLVSGIPINRVGLQYGFYQQECVSHSQPYLLLTCLRQTWSHQIPFGVLFLGMFLVLLLWFLLL
jgi:hypothetical protein